MSWILEDSREATMEAWKAGYVGYGALRLIKTVKDIASSINGPYSNTMPIIQSSGTRKSRMIDEMAKSIFTLPFKLAPTGVDGATYPASDAAIRCHANKYTGRDFVIARYLVFFASLLSVVAEEVIHIWGDSPRVLPSEWRAHLETDDKRASLYRRAVEGVPAIWQEVDERARIKAWVHVEGRTAPSEQRTTRESLHYSEKMFRECASETVKGPIKQLQQAIGHPLEGANSIIVLHFDESYDLLEYKTTDASTYYDCLVSALDALKAAKIIGLFLSTTSFVAKYAPTHENMPSDRAQAEALQPPYTELPFDCHPNFFPWESIYCGCIEHSKVPG